MKQLDECGLPLFLTAIVRSFILVMTSFFREIFFLLMCGCGTINKVSTDGICDTDIPFPVWDCQNQDSITFYCIIAHLDYGRTDKGASIVLYKRIRAFVEPTSLTTIFGRKIHSSNSDS